MKKPLSIAVLSLALVSVTPGWSSAGSFGYFTTASCWPFNCLAACCCNQCCCGKCCGPTVCLRPYNAFSQPISGCLYSDDICLRCPPGGYDGSQGAMPGLPFGGMPSGTAGFDGQTYLAPTQPSDCQPSVSPTPAGKLVPMPNPAAPPAGQIPVRTYGPVPIGYSYGAYPPGPYYTPPAPVPGYWNSNGR
jgi:hypothetical protein